MQRISQRTALTVIFGIAGRMDVPKEECYYRLLPEEPFEEKEETWCCEGCPYGRYSPCIGYCLQKILLEIKQKKAVREKEGDCLAG